MGGGILTLLLSIFPGVDLLGAAFEEVWPEACVVRGPDPIFGGDIRAFHPPAGAFAGVFGGPPCQSFSPLANLVRAKGHEPRFGNLIPEFERVVAEAEPLWFLMEEVPQAPIANVPGYAIHAFKLCNSSLDAGDGLGLEQERLRMFTSRTSRPPSLMRWTGGSRGRSHDLAALFLVVLLVRLRPPRGGQYGNAVHGGTGGLGLWAEDDPGVRVPIWKGWGVSEAYVIRHGDMRQVLAGLEPESVDAVVCDPPYGLSFMGRAWDHDVPGPEFWAEALRVMKPGAHLVAFGGTRTFHWLTVALEEAGFEIRDCLSWLYGSGFPKSLDVSKAIDKALGAKRETARTPMGPTGNKYASGLGDGRPWMADAARAGFHEHAGPHPVTAAAAAALQGWGTALKPAWEPIILARKPLAGTVAGNVLEHGTGALNVDGCRIETAETWDGGGPTKPREGGIGYASSSSSSSHPLGRWPANVCLDEDAAEQLDAQSGATGQRGDLTGEEPSSKTAGVFGKYAGRVPSIARGDSGGASRFFYTAKAASGERHYAGRNHHPTVKPVTLMRWLVRLVTPRGGLVVDPFCGSGSTGVAALAEGFRFLGIDLDEENCKLARRRIAGPLFVGEPEASPVEGQP